MTEASGRTGHNASEYNALLSALITFCSGILTTNLGFKF